MERNPWGGVVLLILVVVIVVIYRWHHKHNVVGAVVVEKPECTNNHKPYATRPLWIKGRPHLRCCYHSGEPLPIQIEFVWIKPIPILGRRSEQQKQAFLGSLEYCLDKIFERLNEAEPLSTLSTVINGEDESGDKWLPLELAIMVRVIDPHNHEEPKVLTNAARQNLLNPPCR